MRTGCLTKVAVIGVVGVLALSGCSHHNTSRDNETGGVSVGKSSSNGGKGATGIKSGGVNAGSTKSSADNSRPKTYKIGWQGPLSGDNQQLGINEVYGARLAVEQANAADLLGVKLKLVESDDVGSADNAAAAAAKLIQDPAILGVVGPALSGPTFATGKTYAAAQMGLISGSANDAKLTSAGFSTFHRVVPTDGVQATQVAEWLAKKFKRVFLVDDTTSYGKGVVDVIDRRLRDKGISVIRQGVAQNTQDYGAIAQKVTASNAEALFYGGYDAQAALFARALVATGFKGRRITGANGKSSIFSSGSGAAGNGWYFSCGCQDATTAPEARGFAAAYQIKFNTPPSTYSAESFDATNALIEAIKAAAKKGTPTRTAVAKEIDNLDYQGITTQVKFTANGDVAAATVDLYQQIDGKIVMLGKIQDQP